MTLEEYEKNRPDGEQKIDLGPAIVRVSLNTMNKEVRVVINRKSKDGYEQIPLGYILGSNYAIYKWRD